MRSKFQKESLSEYGSGWEWEENTYAHVFDQETTFLGGIPYRLSNNGVGFDTSKDYCNSSELEITNGNYLSSYTHMLNQKSCNPNTGNAGNWYSWPAATAGGYHETKGYNEPNSLCPNGWQLTVNAETEVKSWYYLFRNAYNIQDSNDSKLLPLPMSFVRSGNYSQGSLGSRANSGNYWSSAAADSSYAYYLYFYSGNLCPQCGYNKYYGYSVRCVSR